MKTYLLLFTSSLLTAFALTPLVRRFAFRFGAVDVPNEARRIHKQPTARLGGLAIFGALLLALGGLVWLNNLVSVATLQRLTEMTGLLVAAGLIFALGVIDDFIGLNARVKTLVQVLAAAILYADGFALRALSTPFGEAWQLPGWLGFALSALWIVGITNAFNLIDGIDGLASGASVFALLSLFVTSLLQGHTEICVLSIILAGGVMGFLPYNFNPASIFLGDSGSLFLGFMCASLSLVSAQKSSTLVAVAIPLVSFGLPIVEVGLSMTRRFLSGAPIFQSDRRHIHHMLLQRGLNQRQTVILLYAVCAAFSLFGILLLNPQRNQLALIFTILGVCIVLGVQHLRYDEFNGLGQSILKTLTRPRRLSTSLQIERAALALREARSTDQLFAALNELCSACQLVDATLSIQRVSLANTLTRQSNETALATNSAWQKQLGAPAWHWGEQANNAQQSQLDQCCTMRLPLISASGLQLGTLTLSSTLMNVKVLAYFLQDNAQYLTAIVDVLEQIGYHQTSLQLVKSSTNAMNQASDSVQSGAVA